MTTMVDSRQRRELLFGIQVNRAAATVPTSAADQALFTISGGRVIVTSLVGEVTTVVGGTTPSIQLLANPSAAGASVAIASAAVVTADAVGNLYGIGTVGGILIVLESVTPVGAAFVVKAGTIDLNTSAADMTGAMKWTLTYVPLDDGATVVAA